MLVRGPSFLPWVAASSGTEVATLAGEGPFGYRRRRHVDVSGSPITGPVPERERLHPLSPEHARVVS